MLPITNPNVFHKSRTSDKSNPSWNDSRHVSGLLEYVLYFNYVPRGFPRWLCVIKLSRLDYTSMSIVTVLEDCELLDILGGWDVNLCGSHLICQSRWTL